MHFTCTCSIDENTENQYFSLEFQNVDMYYVLVHILLSLQRQADHYVDVRLFCEIRHLISHEVSLKTELIEELRGAESSLHHELKISSDFAS